MPKSKHYRWHTHWKLDGPVATHETGLIVMLRDGRPVSPNLDTVARDLQPKHGHTTPERLTRLLREGAASILGVKYRDLPF